MRSYRISRGTPPKCSKAGPARSPASLFRPAPARSRGSRRRATGRRQEARRVPPRPPCRSSAARACSRRRPPPRQTSHRRARRHLTIRIAASTGAWRSTNPISHAGAGVFARYTSTRSDGSTVANRRSGPGIAAFVHGRERRQPVSSGPTSCVTLCGDRRKVRQVDPHGPVALVRERRFATREPSDSPVAGDELAGHGEPDAGGRPLSPRRAGTSGLLISNQVQRAHLVSQ